MKSFSQNARNTRKLSVPSVYSVRNWFYLRTFTSPPTPFPYPAPLPWTFFCHPEKDNFGPSVGEGGGGRLIVRPICHWPCSGAGLLFGQRPGRRFRCTGRIGQNWVQDDRRDKAHRAGPGESRIDGGQWRVGYRPGPIHPHFSRRPQRGHERGGSLLVENSKAAASVFFVACVARKLKRPFVCRSNQDWTSGIEWYYILK